MNQREGFWPYILIGCTPDITSHNVKSLIIKSRDYMRLGSKNKTPIIHASKRSFVKNQINFSSVILGPLIEPQKQAPRPLELEIWQNMA